MLPSSLATIIPASVSGTGAAFATASSSAKVDAWVDKESFIAMNKRYKKCLEERIVVLVNTVGRVLWIM